MKPNKSVIISAVLALFHIAFCAGLQADELEPQGLNGTKQVNGEFGIYKLEPTMRRVPITLAAPDKVLAQRGGMAFVETDKAQLNTGSGSIVRNLLTDELTTLTGNIIVLAEGNSDLTELAQRAGMRVVNAYANTDIWVLKIEDGEDLLAASKVIKASDLIVESRVEIAHHDKVPQ